MTETVVLCGSLGSTSAMWDAQRPALERRRVVFIDHPGHGDAPAADVGTVADLAALVLERAGAASFSFVGLSLGGAVGIQLALSAPQRVDRLVLACTSARFGEPADWEARAALVRRDGLEPLVDVVLGRWFTAAFGDLNGFRQMFLSTDRESYAQCSDALARWDVRGQLGRIDAATLVIAADEDPSTPPEHAELIAHSIPGARLELIERAAHLANVERPDTFNALLEEWL